MASGHWPEPMFATFVVGSLPRPVWVRELIERRKRGEVSPAAAARMLDDAVPAAIRMQEAAGMDFVSDGEWRRESYVKVFADAVAGFEPDLIAGGRGAAYPAVTATLRQERPIALDEARFVQRTTTRRTLTAVPSPYTVARRMWSPEHSRAAYATREDFMEACIPIINGELKRLTSLGVDAIQLDDPWLALLVDPDYRSRVGIDDVDHEIDMAVQGVNGAVEGVEHPLISVHLCHAHSNRQHSTRGPYDLVIGALGGMNVRRFAMEFATPDAGGIEVLAQFPGGQTAGIGRDRPHRHHGRIFGNRGGTGRSGDAVRACRAADAESGLRVCPVQHQPDGLGRGVSEVEGIVCGGSIAEVALRRISD